MAGAAAVLAAVTILAAAVGSEANRAGLLRAGRGAAGHSVERLTRIQAQFVAIDAFLSPEERTAHRKVMPASKHRRRGKPRQRWAPPPRPPHRPITEQDRAEDALLDDRLHQLFGPPTTVHQGGNVDWSWEQYQEAVTQLETEGVIRSAREVVD